MLFAALVFFIFTAVVAGALAAFAISADALTDVFQWRATVRVTRQAERRDAERELREWLSKRR